MQPMTCPDRSCNLVSSARIRAYLPNTCVEFFLARPPPHHGQAVRPRSTKPSRSTAQSGWCKVPPVTVLHPGRKTLCSISGQTGSASTAGGDADLIDWLDGAAADRPVRAGQRHTRM
jgi:hypothetical protein